MTNFIDFKKLENILLSVKLRLAISNEDFNYITQVNHGDETVAKIHCKVQILCQLGKVSALIKKVEFKEQINILIDMCHQFTIQGFIGYTFCSKMLQKCSELEELNENIPIPLFSPKTSPVTPQSPWCFDTSDLNCSGSGPTGFKS